MASRGGGPRWHLEEVAGPVTSRAVGLRPRWHGSPRGPRRRRHEAAGWWRPRHRRGGQGGGGRGAGLGGACHGRAPHGRSSSRPRTGAGWCSSQAGVAGGQRASSTGGRRVSSMGGQRVSSTGGGGVDLKNCGCGGGGAAGEVTRGGTKCPNFRRPPS
jgi:hypothetical protein